MVGKGRQKGVEMFQRIPAETKRAIMEKLKAGETVAQLSQQYQVSTKTVYTWLQKDASHGPSILEMNKLRQERDALLKIVGKLTLEMSKSKKNHAR